MATNNKIKSIDTITNEVLSLTGVGKLRGIPFRRMSNVQQCALGIIFYLSHLEGHRQLDVVNYWGVSPNTIKKMKDQIDSLKLKSNLHLAKQVILYNQDLFSLSPSVLKCYHSELEKTLPPSQMLRIRTKVNTHWFLQEIASNVKNRLHDDVTDIEELDCRVLENKKFLLKPFNM